MSDACWSPAMPAMTGRPGRISAAPTAPVESTMVGSRASGMRRASSTWGLQPEPSPWMRPVTPALEASVTWRRPPDRVQATQVSTVPKASSPRSERDRSGSARSSRAATLVAEALGATRMPWPWSSRQVPTVRRSCQPSPGPDRAPRWPGPTRWWRPAGWRCPPPSTGPPSARLAEATSMHRGGHGGGVELDQSGERGVRQHLDVVDVGDLAVGADHRPPHARGAHVDHQHAHGQGTGPNGPVRPSLPGLRIPWGSRASLTEARTAKPAPRAVGQEAGPVEPDAVVVADRPTRARGWPG